MITFFVCEMPLNTHMHPLQIVCERSEVFASACALVRAFPQFSRKTNSIASDSSVPKTKEKSSHVVNVEFICTDGRSVTEEDVLCLNHVARGIQMTARIVDTPCNEMHTDAFLNVRHFDVALLYIPQYLESTCHPGFYLRSHAAQVNGSSLAVLTYVSFSSWRHLEAREAWQHGNVG